VPVSIEIYLPLLQQELRLGAASAAATARAAGDAEAAVLPMSCTMFSLFPSQDFLDLEGAEPLADSSLTIHTSLGSSRA
jgi:hypothetical protein